MSAPKSVEASTPNNTELKYSGSVNLLEVHCQCFLVDSATEGKIQALKVGIYRVFIGTAESLRSEHAAAEGIAVPLRRLLIILTVPPNRKRNGGLDPVLREVQDGVGTNDTDFLRLSGCPGPLTPFSGGDPGQQRLYPRATGKDCGRHKSKGSVVSTSISESFAGKGFLRLQYPRGSWRDTPFLFNYAM